jgi:glutaredoxin
MIYDATPRLARIVALALALASSLATATLSAQEVPPVDLEVFVGRGCPHCARALVWLDSLRAERPEVDARVGDVVVDSVALGRLAGLSRERDLGGVTVPTFLIRGQYVVVGFDTPATTGAMIEGLLFGAESADSAAAAEPGPPIPPADEPPGTSPPAELERPSVSVPLIGAVYLDEVGLPAFTGVIGLLDGFNPCAMWVLLFLLSLLVHVRSRARMALIGGVFVVVSGVVYFAFMAAWLNVFRLLGMARGIQITLGAVALLLGALNVKDAFWVGRGPSLGIPEAAKPGIYARVRRIVTAERLAPALGAVVVLALLVNTVELLCTAGLPALYTRILTLRELSVWEYHAYLLVYNVFYMFDDAVMLGIAIVTLSHRRLRQNEARGLKLLSGAVMGALGVLLLIQPDWLLG